LIAIKDDTNVIQESGSIQICLARSNFLEAASRACAWRSRGVRSRCHL